MTGAEQLVEAARFQAENGDVRGAIAALTGANRERRHAAIEIALASLRHEAYDQVTDPPLAPPPDAPPIELSFVDGLPTVAPSQLNSQVLSQAIASHGCLFVPGLLDAQQVDATVRGIDHTFAALDHFTTHPYAERSLEDRAWFEPFKAVGPYAGMETGGRSFTRSTGGVWTIESPRMLFDLLELFDQTGLTQAITGHLGERPALSAAKCNVRRTPVHIPGGWHQDGSFIGLDVTSVDAWIALSHCGTDAPGLDLVPHRFEHLLPTGPDGVVIPHETVLEEVERLGETIVGRNYEPGDALLFDHLFLHRTAVSPEMTRDRYALETWFFGPSSYPGKQIPFLS